MTQVCKLALLTLLFCWASMSFGETVDVTVNNFVRAETDRYFKNQADRFGVGKFRHYQALAPIESQRVVRMNRDTIYSAAVFDLTHPVTITKPDSKDRFQSLHVINQDHYTKLVAYEPGDYTLTQDGVGTRYAFVILRTLVDETKPEDVQAVHDLQNRVRVKQQEAGVFQVPDWDSEQLDSLRDAAKVLGSSVEDSWTMFGDTGTVDPVMHLLGAAYGWGGLPKEDAVYLSETPVNNDGSKPHTLTVRDVPVDAFWSVSLYNESGFFEKNVYDAYVINDRNAKKNPDGSITIHFGGDPEATNYLPIMKGWNYTVRMYRPREEVLNQQWRFPLAQPAE